MSSCTWGAVAFPIKSWHVLQWKAVVLIKLVTKSSPLLPDWKHCWLARYLPIKWENKRYQGGISHKTCSFMHNSHSFNTVLETLMPSQCLAKEDIIHVAHQELNGDILCIFSNANKQMYGMSSDYLESQR